MPLPPLYKYLDVQGARLTLRNVTFKHAKPTDFNDIEDLTVQSVFPEPTEIALLRLQREFTNVILAHLNEPPTCDPPLRDQVALVQQIYRDSPELARLAREERARIPDPQEIEPIRQTAASFLNEINQFMQGYRVLCVTTHKDSERMWAGYAANHRGIALRIQANLEKDSKFQLFRPVVYREHRPSLYDNTLDFIIDTMFGDQQAKRLAMLNKIIYSKTLAWQHEGEYRLAIPRRDDEDDWNTLPYHPEEITELYLGMDIEVEDAEEFVAMASTLNPAITVYGARRNRDRSIGFEQISP